MEIFLIIASTVVLATIGSGLFLVSRNTDSSKHKIKKALALNLSVFIPVVVFALISCVPEFASAASTGAEVNGMGLMAAALSTGLACIGAGYAVAVVGSASLGAISEDSTMFGKTLIFAGLSEGIAIYGLIISIIILGRI